MSFEDFGLIMLLFISIVLYMIYKFIIYLSCILSDEYKHFCLLNKHYRSLYYVVPNTVICGNKRFSSLQSFRHHKSLEEIVRKYVEYHIDEVWDILCYHEDNKYLCDEYEKEVTELLSNCNNELRKFMYKRRVRIPWIYCFRVNYFYTSPAGKNHYTGHEDFSPEFVQNICEKYFKQKYGFDDEKEFVKKQRSMMSKGLRYDVLQRDNFCCVVCGRNADDGVKLEVDHIKPVSKGGKTEISNLQTLCLDCNRGKSAKYDE